LNLIEEPDANFLEDKIIAQAQNGKIYKVDEKGYKKFVVRRVRGLSKTVTVSVPEETKSYDN